MSPSRRNAATDKSDPSAPTIVPEDDDTGDNRTFDHAAAQAVREGELSAAQLPDGHGNVDPTNPDAQYPPGVVDNRAPSGDIADDPASFVPERRGESNTEIASLRTTSDAPNYTYADE